MDDKQNLAEFGKKALAFFLKDKRCEYPREMFAKVNYRYGKFRDGWSARFVFKEIRRNNVVAELTIECPSRPDFNEMACFDFNEPKLARSDYPKAFRAEITKWLEREKWTRLPK